MVVFHDQFVDKDIEKPRLEARPEAKLLLIMNCLCKGNPEA
jgi:hypothetical protein